MLWRHAIVTADIIGVPGINRLGRQIVVANLRHLLVESDQIHSDPYSRFGDRYPFRLGSSCCADSRRKIPGKVAITGPFCEARPGRNRAPLAGPVRLTLT